MSFSADLAELTSQLEAQTWPEEIRTLKRVRNLRQLEQMAQDGWLTPSHKSPRLKLVRHSSGTFLVVEYDKKGWSTRRAMQPMHG